jgi:hypothetical protein
MPGRGSYGPGGKWIHDRANRVLGKGDLEERYGDDAKSVAYAIATQQAHKMGKTPKKKGGYGTREGRVTAKAKYDQPRKAYKKTAADMTKVNRILEILKQASMAGQDLRKGFVGNPRFPTADSKTLSNQLLAKSQKAAEVGPAPTSGRVGNESRGPTFKDAAPKMGTTMGSLPSFKKEGSAMSDIRNDPLSQYLVKNAAKLSGKKKGSTEIEEPHVREMQAKGRGEFVSTLKALFDNAPSDQ